ncbi:DUF456 domain-containing protein [Mycolicibacterium sp.]|uniref:DUF456 domain-containing protein n=1 Tax=Mycolicibacterium sp. TaxID=2320850 RepID=UPI0037CAB0EF
MSQFTNFTESDLAGAAGDDPWKLNREIQAGDPGAINDLADAFHQAGMHTKEADDEFEAAKRQFKDAYKRNGSGHPINDSAEVQRASAALAGHPEQLSNIAVDLEQVAAALATGQRDCDAQIASLENQLHAIDDSISANPDSRAELYQSAVDATKTAVGNIEGIRGAYIAQLNAAETAMNDAGYSPDVIDGADGVAGNAPAEIAREYKDSGQLARDQAMVDKARQEGRTGSARGLPGAMTDEEAAAAQRLADYKAITDPAHGPARHQAAHGDDRPRRSAAQRLDDYLVANSTGPVPKDPVLGGDARTRAEARLKLQFELQNGIAWPFRHMTPDEATQLMNEAEVSDRSNALLRLQGQLQQSGMTAEGAAQVANDMAHGLVPKELADGAGAATKPIAAGDAAFGEAASRLPVDDWRPSGAPYTPEDAELLRKLGGRIGFAGNVLEFGVALYDISHGEPPVQVLAKTGGGMAGAWALGAVGGEIGAFAGPPGVFVGALIGATIGGFGGEAAASAAYDWATGK